MATDNNNALHEEQNDVDNMEIETDEQSEGRSDSELQFVNQGFLKWEESRKSWISTSTAAQENCREKTEAKALDVDEIIDLIFSQRWRSQAPERSQFPEAVPLPQMVDILVDLWEAEGLDI
mmetsp:Transcript_8302/g.12783  ORF Transcript_8302/g.12783 Transcript_8302/m.12783 type:complete len:121 (+) Transcript_8302:35-397(+)